MKDQIEKLVGEIKDFIVAIAYTQKDIKKTLHEINQRLREMQEK